jgi:hypothetical protein
VVERHPGLGGNGPSEHRLAGAGRAVEHDPARDPGAQLVEPLRRPEELDRLGQLELGLVATGDVSERDRRGGLGGCVGAGHRCAAFSGRRRRHDRPE